MASFSVPGCGDGGAVDRGASAALQLRPDRLQALQQGRNRPNQVPQLAYIPWNAVPLTPLAMWGGVLAKNYGPGCDCAYSVTYEGAATANLHLAFPQMDTEPGRDALRISDAATQAESQSDYLIIRKKRTFLCRCSGEGCPVFTSAAGSVKLHFASDFNREASGSN